MFATAAAAATELLWVQGSLLGEFKLGLGAGAAAQSGESADSIQTPPRQKLTVAANWKLGLLGRGAHTVGYISTEP